MASTYFMSRPLVSKYDCVVILSSYLNMIQIRGGLVVGRPTAVREDPGSNLTVAGRQSL